MRMRRGKEDIGGACDEKVTTKIVTLYIFEAGSSRDNKGGGKKGGGRRKRRRVKRWKGKGRSGRGTSKYYFDRVTNIGIVVSVCF